MRLLYQTLSILPLLLLLPGLTGARKSEKGHWGEWGQISPCSVTCGSGSQRKVRSWIPGPNEKLQKPVTFSSNFICTSQVYPECPTNGHWSEWWFWTECSRMCGGGTRSRTRDCVGVTYNGKECPGKAEEIQDCKGTPCPSIPRQFQISQCSHHNFTCESNKMCVQSMERCDGTVQCHDGSDEKECPKVAGIRRGSVRYGLSNGRSDGISHKQADKGILTVSLLTITCVLWPH